MHLHILLAAFAVMTIGFVFKALRNPLAKVPGPWYSKFTSIVLAMEGINGRRARYVHKLHDRYGPYSTYLLCAPPRNPLSH